MKENTLIGEWKGDLSDSKPFRVLANGHFDVEPENLKDGEIYVNLNSKQVDLSGAPDGGATHRVGSYSFGHPDRIDLSDGKYLERMIYH